MKLQTVIPLIPQKDNPIDYKSQLLLLGSCFSEHIGEKLSHFKFQNLSNPFGILFHPKAIERFIFNAVNRKKYTEDAIFFHNEQWHCYDAHSKLSSTSKEQLLNNLNLGINATHLQLVNASHVIITLGTAWVYKHKKTNAIVSNCHKVPQKEFDKTLLSANNITSSLSAIVETIRTINAHATIIFTVSPVRHTKDGFIQNTQSKAHLVTAIHNVLKSSQNDTGLYYFPSFEIMMDELRDYRFYNADLIHPNTLAINYIWQKFQKTWIHPIAHKTMTLIDDIQRGLAHKPFNPESKAHQKFVVQLNQKMSILQAEFPHITFK